MKVRDLKETIKHLAGNTELIYIPAEYLEAEDGKPVPAGLAYFDTEEKEFVFIGEISTIELDEED